MMSTRPDFAPTTREMRLTCGLSSRAATSLLGSGGEASHTCIMHPALKEAFEAACIPSQTSASSETRCRSLGRVPQSFIEEIFARLSAMFNETCGVRVRECQQSPFSLISKNSVGAINCCTWLRPPDLTMAMPASRVINRRRKCAEAHRLAAWCRGRMHRPVSSELVECEFSFGERLPLQCRWFLSG